MSIDNLLRIEITLSNIYYRLLMLEIYGEVESGEYTTCLLYTSLVMESIHYMKMMALVIIIKMDYI